MIFKNDGHYKAFFKAGGAYANFFSMDYKNVSKKLKDVVPKNQWQKVKPWLNPLNGLNALRKASEYLEMATRLQEFKLAKKRGKSDVEAANAAKEATDKNSLAALIGSPPHRGPAPG